MNFEILESYVDDGFIYKEENDELVVYSCGEKNLVKIIIYKDGSYECDFSELHRELEFIIDSIKFENEFTGLEIPYLIDENTKFKYFNNKDIMNVIKKDVKKLLKQLVNKDSFIRAHLYQELINMGYNDCFRLTDFRIKDPRYCNSDAYKNAVSNVAEEIFIHDIKYSRGYYFDGVSMSYHYGDNDEKVSEFDEMVEIIQNVFGVNSNEHNELLSHFIWFDSENENNFKEMFFNSEYPDVVRDMFEYAMIQYEKKYIKYIAENVNISFNLKEAYSVLGEEIKNQLAEDIFYGDLLETKFMIDIISVLSIRCCKKDDKKYERDEIKRFLVDKSSNRVVSLMPEDFDVFKDLGKVENEKIVDRYEQMAMDEEENRRGR